METGGDSFGSGLRTVGGAAVTAQGGFCMYHPQAISGAQGVSPGRPATLQVEGQGFFPAWLPAIDPLLLAIGFVVLGLVILALGLLSQLSPGAARGAGVAVLVLSLAVLVVGGSPFLLGAILGIVGGLWGIRSRRPA